MKKQNTQSTTALFHSLSGGLELVARVLCSGWRRNTTKIKNGNVVKDFLHRDNIFPALRLPSVQAFWGTYGRGQEVGAYREHLWKKAYQYMLRVPLQQQFGYYLVVGF